MVCCWSHSQTADLARPHLSRHGHSCARKRLSGVDIGCKSVVDHRSLQLVFSPLCSYVDRCQIWRRDAIGEDVQDISIFTGQFRWYTVQHPACRLPVFGVCLEELSGVDHAIHGGQGDKSPAFRPGTEHILMGFDYWDKTLPPFLLLFFLPLLPILSSWS